MKKTKKGSFTDLRMDLMCLSDLANPIQKHLGIAAITLIVGIFTVILIDIPKIRSVLSTILCYPVCLLLVYLYIQYRIKRIAQIYQDLFYSIREGKHHNDILNLSKYASELFRHVSYQANIIRSEVEAKEVERKTSLTHDTEQESSNHGNKL